MHVPHMAHLPPILKPQQQSGEDPSQQLTARDDDANVVVERVRRG